MFINQAGEISTDEIRKLFPEPKINFVNVDNNFYSYLYPQNINTIKENIKNTIYIFRRGDMKSWSIDESKRIGTCNVSATNGTRLKFNEQEFSAKQAQKDQVLPDVYDIFQKYPKININDIGRYNLISLFHYIGYNLNIFKPNTLISWISKKNPNIIKFLGAESYINITTTINTRYKALKNAEATAKIMFVDYITREDNNKELIETMCDYVKMINFIYL